MSWWRALLCGLFGHGPWHWMPINVWHEGELRRGRLCSACGEVRLGEVDA